MNLEKVQGIKDLYPMLRLRSGRQIKTTEATSELTKEGLIVTVKILFPPSDRRRVELVVTGALGELHVTPREPSAIADAQRLAELLRARWLGEQPDVGPLRLSKNNEGVCYFTVAAPTAAAAAKPAARIATEKGAS